MSGNLNGAIKTAAKRIGISDDEYREKISLGLKWCQLCRRWQKRDEFAKDNKRGTGLQPGCRKATSEKMVKRYVRKGYPKTHPLALVPVRPGDKRQANGRIARLVRLGLLPKPSSVPCVDCGHIGEDRRHDYDHHLGYSAEHQEHVQAVCTECHYKRGVARGELLDGRQLRLGGKVNRRQHHA